MKAYNKYYLENAQDLLGNVLDFVVKVHHLNLEDFIKDFIASPVASLIEHGDSKILSSVSAKELLNKYFGLDFIGEYSLDKSQEYWTGWSLAYVQWSLDKSFIKILKVCPIMEIYNLYNPYHEASMEKTLDYVKAKFISADTSLKKIRKSRRMSQKELANESGISIRTIQAYEQKALDIKNAKVDIVYALSKALMCDIKDILD